MNGVYVSSAEVQGCRVIRIESPLVSYLHLATLFESSREEYGTVAPAFFLS